MSHYKRTGGNYLDSPSKKPAIKPDPDTPSTVTSKSTQSSRSTIQSAVNAFSKSAKFESSDDDVEIVDNPVNHPTAANNELLLQEIDWFDSESLTDGVIAFCDESDVERAHTMKDGEKVRAIFRAHTPQTLKMVYQGVAQGSGYMSMSDVMTFFRDEIKGNQQRDKLGDAMVTLLKTISKRGPLLNVNPKVSSSKYTGSISGRSGFSSTADNATSNLKQDGDHAMQRGNDGGVSKTSVKGKAYARGKKVEGVSFGPHGGGVIQHGREAGGGGGFLGDTGHGLASPPKKLSYNESEGQDDGKEEWDQFFRASPNHNIDNTESSVLDSNGAFQNRSPSNDDDPLSNEADPLSIEMDPLGDQDFGNDAVPVIVDDIVDDNVEKFPVQFSKPIISANGTRYYVFFFGHRRMLWFLKYGFVSIMANGMVRRLVFTHPKFTPGLHGFAETTRRIPGCWQNKLMKTQKDKDVNITFGVIDLKPNEGIAIEAKAKIIFDLVFKAGFKMYPDAKVNRGSRFLTWCNENGKDGLARWLVKEYGDGVEKSAEDAISVEMNNCFNNPGVQFEWDTPLDQFFPDHEIKRFLVNCIQATGWDDLSESNKEACYRAFSTAGQRRLPDWNSMVKKKYSNN